MCDFAQFGAPLGSIFAPLGAGPASLGQGPESLGQGRAQKPFLLSHLGGLGNPFCHFLALGHLWKEILVDLLQKCDLHITALYAYGLRVQGGLEGPSGTTWAALGPQKCVKRPP